MKEQDLKAMSTEKLQHNAKTIAVATSVLGALLFVEFCLAIYVSIDNTGMLALLVIPFALSPIMFINIKKVRQIKNRQ